MQDIYIGRQEIFDRNLGVFAYELLFRSCEENRSHVNQPLNGDIATSEVLLNTFMEIGLERIAGPHLIFVNVTRNLFLEAPELPFPKDRVVMEILEDVPVDQQLIDSVGRLSEKGYLLALDDYIFDPACDRLLEMVDFVKVEIPAVDPEKLRKELPRLRAKGVKLLAEKIETEAEYQQMQELGFDYFQGYYFSRPRVLQGRRLTENTMVVLRLLAELNNPEVTIEQVEYLITQDARLSYKILRYLNSAAAGMQRKVESIKQAVILMGLAKIRAWASLLAMSRLNHKPQAHFTTGLVRAHMCQQLVSRMTGCPPETGFTVGLLSTLDLLMDKPMAEILDELSLSDEVETALLEQQGPAGEALHCTLCYEEHDWKDIQPWNLQKDELIEINLVSCEQAFLDQQALQQAV